MFNCREEMKYTSEERERKAEKKKSSVCIRGEKLIDCCMNQEMKFFPKGPAMVTYFIGMQLEANFSGRMKKKKFLK